MLLPIPPFLLLCGGGRPHEPPRFVLPLPNVASSLLPVDDDRYVPPLPELHPQQTVREARAVFDDVVVLRAPGSFRPTVAHLAVRNGPLYDDVWLRFERERTHVVSASRLALHDRGVNRNRLARLRRALLRE
jgi:hypothetical protein